MFSKTFHQKLKISLPIKYLIATSVVSFFWLKPKTKIILTFPGLELRKKYCFMKNKDNNILCHARSMSRIVM